MSDVKDDWAALAAKAQPLEEYAKDLTERIERKRAHSLIAHIDLEIARAAKEVEDHTNRLKEMGVHNTWYPALEKDRERWVGVLRAMQWIKKLMESNNV